MYYVRCYVRYSGSVHTHYNLVQDKNLLYFKNLKWRENWSLFICRVNLSVSMFIWKPYLVTIMFCVPLRVGTEIRSDQGAQGTVCSVRVQSGVNCMQGNCLKSSNIFPALCNFWSVSAFFLLLLWESTSPFLHSIRAPPCVRNWSKGANTYFEIP